MPLWVKVRDVRIIGKGNRERLVPLPQAFGQVFGYWLSDKPRFVFAKEEGEKRQGRMQLIGRVSARRSLRISFGNLRHPAARGRRRARGHSGGHFTTQISAHISEDRMSGLWLSSKIPVP